MSLFDCIQRAMDDVGEDGVNANRERGERAQRMWRERSDQYERDGHPRHTAEALAADDVKEAFRREAGQKRHAYLAVASTQRKMQAHVTNAAEPDMIRRMEELDYKHRGMVRRFNARMGEYLKKHHRNILGSVTNAAEQIHIADELHGMASGNAAARALAEGITDALEDLRLMFNEAGGMISKMDNWGLPHVHNRLAVMRAGADEWFGQIDRRLDWSRINDPLTGRPLPAEPNTGLPPEAMRRRFLKEAWDNIVFGKEADDPAYGRPKGVATYRKHMDQRHLHFKSGQDWMEYNRDFGTGGLHQSLMGHVHRMSRDIILMREFGPNPKLGAEYEADLWRSKAKKAGDTALSDAIASDSAVALRMLNVMSGGNVPETPAQQWIATAFSTTRSLLTAAFLDRAIIASLSDMNSMRMAAKSMGMNSLNPIARQVGLAQSLGRDELLRAGWVADTMADAGTALARFQQEVAPQEWAERVTQFSMRAQGLSFWTDRARATAYFEYAGFMQGQADRGFNDLEPKLKSHFQKWNISPADWDEFRRQENVFTADNGATFLAPLHFRKTTQMNAQRADDLFFKMQGAAEEFLELAVPTKSLLAQGWVDPAAYNLPPGSPLFEVAKTGLAFKSFTMTFTINQIRQIKAQPTMGAKIMYGLDLAAGATVLGAVALQLNEVLMGRDPQDMTDPLFMARAAAKGGGFGIIGDIVTTGQASWGGGFSSYIAGPVPQAITDVYGLTVGNAITALYQAAMGEEIDTNFAKELSRFGKRYTPMGQTPLIGPALDRLFWDQLQMILDPESVKDLKSASKKRENLYGGGEYWMPGSPLPTRLPNLQSAIGG
jgi:hypothetical protein